MCVLWLTLVKLVVIDDFLKQPTPDRLLRFRGKVQRLNILRAVVELGVTIVG